MLASQIAINSLQLHPVKCDDNYIIGCSKYVIFLLVESTIPWVHSLQFLCKSAYYSKKM